MGVRVQWKSRRLHPSPPQPDSLAPASTTHPPDPPHRSKQRRGRHAHDEDDEDRELLQDEEGDGMSGGHRCVRTRARGGWGRGGLRSAARAAHLSHSAGQLLRPGVGDRAAVSSSSDSNSSSIPVSQPQQLPQRQCRDRVQTALCRNTFVGGPPPFRLEHTCRSGLGSGGPRVSPRWVGGCRLPLQRYLGAVHPCTVTQQGTWHSAAPGDAVLAQLAAAERAKQPAAAAAGAPHTGGSGSSGSRSSRSSRSSRIPQH